jgi:hypothetical protein
VKTPVKSKSLTTFFAAASKSDPSAAAPALKRRLHLVGTLLKPLLNSQSPIETCTSCVARHPEPWVVGGGGAAPPPPPPPPHHTLSQANSHCAAGSAQTALTP